MYLETFINEHPNNWQDILINEPYYFTIKQNNNYFIINYNPALSNFTNPITLEARGPIFRRESNDTWRCVCRTLDKIADYNDSYAPKNSMNWRNGVDVQEKIDGSTIRIWYDNDEWHISTINEIDAFQEKCSNTTFGDLFLETLGLQNKEQLSYYFSRDWWFWFELVSPYNHFVVKYNENRVYYLGARSRINHMEITQSFGFKELEDKLYYPRHFTFYSLSSCIEAAKKLDNSQEGFVCVSKNHENDSLLRLDVKGASYLKLYNMKGNKPFNLLRATDLWQNDLLDEFLTYYPEYANFINKITTALKRLINTSDIVYKAIMNNKNMINNKEMFLEYANRYTFPLKNYLIEKFNNNIDNAENYYKKLDNQFLTTYLNTFVEDNTTSIKMNN